MIESFGRGLVAHKARLCDECIIPIPGGWTLILVPSNVHVSISTARLRQRTLQIEHRLPQRCIRAFRWEDFTLVLLDDIVAWEPRLWTRKESTISALLITNCTHSEKWVNLIGMIKTPLSRATTSTLFPCRLIVRQFDILGKIRAGIQSKRIKLGLFPFDELLFGDLCVIANQVLN